MQLKFFGGAQEVGRSSILFKDERSIMLDFGLKVNVRTEFPISVPKVDALILSHSHIDHSGFVPAIYNFSQIPAFGTKPTLELAELLQNDAINVAKKQHMRPKYHKRQINQFKSKYTEIPYHKKFFYGSYDMEFYDAGHICGSAVTLIERTRAKNNKRIVYTGDFKIEPQTLHKGAEIVKSDVLIMESTYEGRDHPNRDDLVKKLIEEIRGVLDNGGTALLPSFAVGRSQELLSILYKHGLADRVFVDGMCRAATKIVVKNPKFITNPEYLMRGIDEATWIDGMRVRKNALDEPGIILTTAGMLNGGPVLNYITRLNAESKIFITGYQVEGTNGRLLIDNGYVNIDEKKVRIDTPVSIYDLSAHAGNSDLYEYVRKSAPNIVVCVHGDQRASTNLAEHLKDEGFEAYAPKVGETLNIKE